MLNPKLTSAYKSDIKTVKKRGYDMSLIKPVIENLLNEIPLDPKYKDHVLIGNYKGDRECHIEPDWLLIYTVIESDLVFVRTGTHSDLFG